MKSLYFKTFGDSDPVLVILHGLFGSGQNWTSQARSLSEHYRVLLPDLRNHGQSPHDPAVSYPLMADDVRRLLDKLGVESFFLVGHSMGGKTAMRFALDHPNRVEKLAIVDIAPRAYPPHHDTIFSGLSKLDLGAIKSREEASRQLTEAIPEEGIRAFLLTNLKKSGGAFHWQMNLPVLESQYSHIAAPIEASNAYAGETLIIKGGESDYISARDEADFHALFSNLQLKIIANAGHWPHAEKPQVFYKLLLDFLMR
ncbi:MAG: alpha/beta fold hydrolase [Pseudomonadota bacterium]